MILSDTDIRRALADRRIEIDPAPLPEQFSPSALDFRVGYEFRRWKRQAPGVELSINLSEASVPNYAEYTEEVPADHDGLVTIPKDDFVLAKTLERISLPLTSRLAARVEGRSTLARLGLAVHITAPIIHAGFRGPIVLEIKNLGPHRLRIEPGKTCICQVVFETLSSEPTGDLRTVFQDQDDVLGRRDPCEDG